MGEITVEKPSTCVRMLESAHPFIFRKEIRGGGEMWVLRNLITQMTNYKNKLVTFIRKSCHCTSVVLINLLSMREVYKVKKCPAWGLWERQIWITFINGKLWLEILIEWAMFEDNTFLGNSRHCNELYYLIWWIIDYS